MASRKPIVNVGGHLSELPTGDTLNIPITFLELTDTPGAFTANRVPYMSAAAIITNANFTFDGSVLEAPSFFTTGGSQPVIFTVDGTFSANSDGNVPTEKAIKTYVDGQNLWTRATAILSPANAGDGLNIHAGATFNSDAGDNDFIIKKNVSGDAYKYDAGLDKHIYDSPILTQNGSISALALRIGVDGWGFYRSATQGLKVAIGGIDMMTFDNNSNFVEANKRFESAVNDADGAFKVDSGITGSSTDDLIGYHWKPNLASRTGTPTGTPISYVGFKGAFTVGAGTLSAITIPGVAGFWDAPDFAGANNRTVTTYYGAYFQDGTALGTGFTLTNQYGVYIEAPSRGTTSNIGLYNAGTTTLVGDVSITSTTASTSSTTGALVVSGGAGFAGDVSTATKLRFDDGISIGNGNTGIVTGNGIAIGQNAAQGYTGTGVIAIGSSACQSLSPARVNLIAIGNSALRLGSGGHRSIGIGAQALEDNTSTYSIAIGERAGTQHTSGNNNLFLGSFAGDNNITGADNVFVGHEAGQNATGSDSVFVGLGAGKATTSNGSVFVGFNAGILNTTGLNTCIGFESGRSLTTGTSNTFIGYEAGEDCTGSLNVFIGRSAGLQNTTGSSNTFVGYQAGQNNLTGARNMFLGSAAGALSTGSDNVFIGSNAGTALTSGNSNLLIGSDAGKSLVTASFNTMIGVDAGENATGASNVFIGFQSGQNETGSNKLYIANTNTTTPLIYGEFDTEKVRIYGELRSTAKAEIITVTSITETIDVTTCTMIRQTASGITTTLSGNTTGSKIIIKNRGGGTNTLNLTADGTASPTLDDGDSATLVYNGTDWDII